MFLNAYRVKSLVEHWHAGSLAASDSKLRDMSYMNGLRFYSIFMSDDISNRKNNDNTFA